jgi:tetratricopeptide (TPR) repeat protein
MLTCLATGRTDRPCGVGRRAAVRLLALAAAWSTVTAVELPPESRARAEQLDRWRAQIERARFEVAEGRADRGEVLFREVVEQADAQEENNLLLARAIDGLAEICSSQERFAEAAALYARAADMWERLLGPRQPRLATTLHNLGLVYRALERREEAEASLRRALAIWNETLGGESAEARTTRQAIDSLFREGDAASSR